MISKFIQQLVPGFMNANQNIYDGQTSVNSSGYSGCPVVAFEKRSNMSDLHFSFLCCGGNKVGSDRIKNTYVYINNVTDKFLCLVKGWGWWYRIYSQ